MGQKLTAAQVATMAKRSKSQVNRDATAGRLRIAQEYPGYNGPRLFDKTDAEAYATAVKKGAADE